jgi:hypothetical protein
VGFIPANEDLLTRAERELLERLFRSTHGLLEHGAAVVALECDSAVNLQR